tara:strand:- start:168 stop:293 length:126 start_codon:yes stop_codon:yes gene_type:complete
MNNAVMVASALMALVASAEDRSARQTVSAAMAPALMENVVQ